MGHTYQETIVRDIKQPWAQSNQAALRMADTANAAWYHDG